MSKLQQDQVLSATPIQDRVEVFVDEVNEDPTLPIIDALRQTVTAAQHSGNQDFTQKPQRDDVEWPRQHLFHIVHDFLGTWSLMPPAVDPGQRLRLFRQTQDKVLQVGHFLALCRGEEPKEQEDVLRQVGEGAEEVVRTSLVKRVQGLMSELVMVSYRDLLNCREE